MATAKKTTAKTSTTARKATPTPRKTTTTRTRKSTPKAKINPKAPVTSEFLIKRANNGFVLDIMSDAIDNQLVFTDEQGVDEVIKTINNTILEMYKA